MIINHRSTLIQSTRNHEEGDMKSIVREIENRKAIHISLTILAPVLLIIYWRPIIEIGIVGGTAFGLVFLMVKHHGKLLGLVRNTRQRLFQHMSQKINEEKTH